MNGLNESELKMLNKLRQMNNLSEARVAGIKWLNANKKRKHLRLLALRTVKSMYASDITLKDQGTTQCAVKMNYSYESSYSGLP